MIINNLRLRGKNINGDVNDAAYTGEIVANSDLDDAAMSQGDDRSAIATFTSLSPKIPESNSEATLKEKTQLHLSVQEDPIANPSGKQSCSLSKSGWTDGLDSNWAFNIFAEGDSDSETESDSLLFSK